MRVLVLVTDYPRLDGEHAYMFVHVRNKYYRRHGVEVTVLNFSAKENYNIEGIPVISIRSYRETDIYDCLISHASNIRNHYMFLKKYEKVFKKIIFFFHGQEVLYLNESYPKPYEFMDSGRIWKRQFRNVYDCIKIYLWSSYYKKLSHKSQFVFVSDYIWKMFQKNLKIDLSLLMNRTHIIHNSISPIFETTSYDIAQEKKYDFITIRSNWDSSTYCIDLLVKIANDNPKSSFLLIGKGRYFDYNVCPANLELINHTISHEEMIGFLNKSKCAINLTRQDTQGVMTCELVAFGIPVITSNISVAHDFFYSKPNVCLIPNEGLADVCKISEELSEKLPYSKDNTFFAINTVDREVELIKQLISSK